MAEAAEDRRPAEPSEFLSATAVPVFVGRRSTVYWAGWHRGREKKSEMTKLTLPSEICGWCRCTGRGKVQGDANRWIQKSKAKIRFRG